MDWVETRQEHLLTGVGPATKLHAFEQCFDDVFATARHGDRDAEIALDFLVLSEQNVEHNAVDLIINTQVCKYADLGLWLTKSVDATFSLFVPGRIPAKIIM